MRCIQAVILICCCLFAVVAADKPNIVWIVSEDNSALVGPYAQGQVATPNLDRMAAEGVVYDRAYLR